MEPAPAQQVRAPAASATTEAPQAEARFAKTLLGMPAFVPAPAPLPSAPPSITPQALAKAFSAAHFQTEHSQLLEEHAAPPVQADTSPPSRSEPDRAIYARRGEEEWGPSRCVQAAGEALPDEGGRERPPLEDEEVRDESATIPMPRLSEEEMMATFGLEVPLRGVSAPPDEPAPPVSAADIHLRVTQPLPPREALLGDEHGPLSSLTTEVLPRVEATGAGGPELPVSEPDQVQADLPIAQEAEEAPALKAAQAEPRETPVLAKAPINRPKPFRETAWFKQGEVSEMLEDPQKGAELLVTAEDHARLSLGSTGRTGMHQQADLTAKPEKAPSAELPTRLTPEEKPAGSRLVTAAVTVLVLSGVLLGAYLWLLAP
jgi:hypothetical protein